MTNLKTGEKGEGQSIKRIYIQSLHQSHCAAMQLFSAIWAKRSLKSVLQGISSLLNAYTSEKTLIAPEDEYIGSALTALAHRYNIGVKFEYVEHRA